jgi:hypothetical protein
MMDRPGLLNFSEFVLESDASSDSEFIDLLKDALEAGILSRSEYISHIRKLGNPELLSVASRDVIAALESPEAKRIFDAGLTLVSSVNQMLRGNIAFGRPDFAIQKDCSIVLFPEPRYIRRYPASRRFNQWQTDWRPQVLMKLDRDGSTVDFYRLAMRWIADHLDLNSECFKSKKRTSATYFDTHLG